MATTNDIVLIHLEDTPVSFARIESILPDAKKDWYQVRLLMLQVPLQVVTWILRNDYINGDEFSMDGKKMRFELVKSPVQDLPSIDSARKKNQEKNQGKKGKKSKKMSSSDKTDGQLISLDDFRKPSPAEDDYEPEPG